MNIFKNYIRLWMLLIASIMSCVAIAQDDNYGIGDGFDPANPGNPGSNGWNAATGEVIIDDFTTGNLSNSITKIIGNSGSAAVTQIVVAGVINNTDFRVGNNYAKCTLVDFSRTAGISSVPSSAYSGNTHLCSIMLPTSITDIGSNAFKGCSALAAMTCYTLTPPTVGSNALNGVADGMIVYVPSEVVGRYQEADTWKDFTVLPIQETVHSLTVKLPTDIDLGTFKNMTLELVNAKSGQSYRYIITDKASYVFNNLIENTVYKAYVKNNLNNIFGETDEVSVNDKDAEVTFASLSIPQNVNLSILAGGNDVTSQATVTWTDSIGNYLSQGSSLTGYAIGKKLNYSIALPQNIVMEYALPNTMQYVVADGGNNIVCTLTPLQKVVITGKVLDLTTKSAISGAVVSASQTFGGKYSKTTNVKTDSKGQYSIEIFRVPTSLAIAASDYISQTMECDVINAEEKNISVDDVSLKSITGAVISIDFTYKKCPDKAGEEGEVESFYTDYNNVDYTIFNKTQNRSIGQFNAQYPQIVLLEEVNENDVLELTASSRTSAFVPVKATATIDAEQRASATFNVVELGKMKASFEVNANATVVGSLYDANGKLLKTYDYSGGSLTVSNLADGDYTLVTMGGSRLFNTIYDLSQLPQTGLVKDVDYVQNSVSIKNGELSIISIVEVPTLDESKLYYTGDNTSFTVNKSSIVAGNYLTLTGHLDFKSAYSTKVSNVNLIVDLPESCSFVENSVMVGNSTSSYTLNGNRLTIPMSRYTDRVRFCIIPTAGGEYAPSALAQFDIDGETITQPIGSVSYTAKDLSISVPSTVAKTTIPVSGTAIGASDIEIYDGDVLIGQTRSLANGTWATTCELINPYNLSTHNIFAKVTTKAGIGLLSETVNCLYDKNAIEVNTVTMINTAHTSANLDLYDYVTVFDFQNPKESYPAYWYWPSYPDFTFLVDFTNNDTTIVKDVVLYVFTDNDDVVTLYPEYDDKQDKFVATAKFNSYSLPYNVSVDFYAETENFLSRKALDECVIDIDSISNNTKENITILDKLIEQYENETNGEKDQIQARILSLLRIGEPTEDDYIYVGQEKLFEDVENSIINCDNLIEGADSTILPNTLALSLFQELDLSQFDLDGTLKIETCDKINLDELYQKGYDSFLTDEGDSIYFLITETMFNYIDPSKNISLILKSDVEINNRARKSNGDAIGKVKDYVYEVRNKAVNFKTLINTIKGIINKNVIGPLNFKIANYNTTIRCNLRLESELSKLASETQNPKVYEDCMKGIQRLQAKNKVIYRQIEILNGSLSVALRIASGITSLYGIVYKMFELAKDLNDYVSLYYSVPNCECVPSLTTSLQRRIAATGIARGALYFYGIASDIVAIKVAIGGVAAAPASGGSSLSATAASILKLLGQQIVYAGLAAASEHLKGCYRVEINSLIRNSECWNCSPPKPKPNPTPTPPSPPGGGAPNVKDPSGYVYEGVSSNRLEGVTATAYYKETVEDMYGDKHENIVKWDASEYAQENPLFTDENGMYAWDVPNGLWQVKFEKEGYETTYSEWLPVPPPQLDINIAMKQNAQPTVKAARAFQDAVEMEFDKYMMPELLTSDNIRVMAGENAVEGTVELLNEEVSYEGNEEKFASKVRFNAAAPFDATEVTLMVSNRVKSYAGIRMQDDFSQTFSIEPEVQKIVCDAEASIEYGGQGELTVQVLPAVASAGKTLKVKSSSAMILSTDVEELTLDNEGKASLTVGGELPGAAAITYTIDGYDLSATTMVNVEQVQLVPDRPLASIASGSALLKGTQITLSCPTSSAEIYYTTDGSCPCEAGAKKYDGTPITISEGTTLKIMAKGKKGDESEIVTYTYTLRQTNLNVPLAKGWNWVSHNQDVALTSDKLEMENVDRVLTQIGELYRDPKIGFTGHIDDVNATDAFKVHTTDAGNLQLGGVMFNPYFSPVELKRGWNWLGYPLEKPMTVDDAFSLMESEANDYIVNLEGGFAQFNGDNWTGTLETLTPGQGYLFKSASDKELAYNIFAAAAPSANAASVIPSDDMPWQYDSHAYPNVMCVTADLYVKDVKAVAGEYLVGAFVDGECRGVGRYVDNTLFLSVHGDKNVEMTLLAMDNESGVVYDITERLMFTPDVVGSVSMPYPLHVGSPTGISHITMDNSNFKSIHNVLGQKVKSIDRGGVFIIDGRKRVVTKRNEQEYLK